MEERRRENKQEQGCMNTSLTFRMSLVSLSLSSLLQFAFDALARNDVSFSFLLSIVAPSLVQKQVKKKKEEEKKRAEDLKTSPVCVVLFFLQDV